MESLHLDLKVGPLPEEASKRPEPNKTRAKPEVSTRPETRSADGWPSQDPPIHTGVADTWTGETGVGGKVAEPLHQEREFQVPSIMMSAKDHDERVENESEWLRRSEERKKR